MPKHVLLSHGRVALPPVALGLAVQDELLNVFKKIVTKLTAPCLDGKKQAAALLLSRGLRKTEQNLLI